jgi:hypothetical protein
MFPAARCDYGVVAGVLALLWVGVGCTGIRPGGYGRAVDAPRPVVAVVYYPYEESLVRDVAVPVPDYSGWPDERMVRDFSRMAACGADVALVAIDPRVVREAGRAQRYERLLQLRRRHAAWPRVGFWLQACDCSADAVREDELVAWLGSLAGRYGEILFDVDGRAVVVVAPGFGPAPGQHPALTWLPAGPHGAWFWPAAARDALELSPDGAGAVVSAGMAVIEQDGRVTWSVPRRRGKTLDRALAAALAAAPKFLCVASWNDYADGSFVEPNSLDGKRAMDAMARWLTPNHKP